MKRLKSRDLGLTSVHRILPSEQSPPKASESRTRHLLSGSWSTPRSRLVLARPLHQGAWRDTVHLIRFAMQTCSKLRTFSFRWSIQNPIVERGVRSPEQVGLGHLARRSDRLTPYPLPALQKQTPSTGELTPAVTCTPAILACLGLTRASRLVSAISPAARPAAGPTPVHRMSPNDARDMACMRHCSPPQ